MEILYTGNAPQYMSAGAAGADLSSAEDYTIKPGEQTLVNTGTAIAVPTGNYAMLVPRSSLCNKKGLVLANSVGIIDSDYRGNIMCCYRNTGKDVVEIAAGERVAQILIIAHATAEFKETIELPDTERGTGGFGSTGK